MTSPVGVVNLAAPVGVVNLAPPVGVVNLAAPVGVVNLTSPVGVVNLAPSVVNLTTRYLNHHRHNHTKAAHCARKGFHLEKKPPQRSRVQGAKQPEPRTERQKTTLQRLCCRHKLLHFIKVQMAASLLIPDPPQHAHLRSRRLMVTWFRFRPVQQGELVPGVHGNGSRTTGHLKLQNTKKRLLHTPHTHAHRF